MRYGSFDRRMHSVVCTECGAATEVPFQPKAGRPIYCRDCYAKLKPRYATASRTDQGEQAPPVVSDAPEAPTEEVAPDFEFAGIVGPDGRPLGRHADIPAQVRLVVCEIDEDLIEWLRSNPQRMRELHPRVFERLVADRLKRQGYEVELTPSTRDGGFDMYAARSDCLGRFLFLVECKCYGENHKVGVRVVRELYGAVQEKRATAGVVVTTSSFSKGAKEFQRDISHQLSLKDYDDLQQWLRFINQPVGHSSFVM